MTCSFPPSSKLPSQDPIYLPPDSSLSFSHSLTHCNFSFNINTELLHYSLILAPPTWATTWKPPPSLTYSSLSYPILYPSSHSQTDRNPTIPPYLHIPSSLSFSLSLSISCSYSTGSVLRPTLPRTTSNLSKPIIVITSTTHRSPLLLQRNILLPSTASSLSVKYVQTVQ